MTAPIVVTSGLILLAALVLRAVIVLSRRRRTVGFDLQRRQLPEDVRPAGGRAAPVPAAGLPAPQVYTGLTKAEAEALLDWLEGNGQSGAELSYDEQSGFSVRCR
jgi:hypothetical protein